MEPFRRWVDLPLDLLCRIGDWLDLKWYANAQGVCTAWRYALVSPSPALLIVTDSDRWCPYTASLPTRRSFELTTIVSGSRCIGSSNGWLALSVIASMYETVFVLLNPYEYETRCDWVSKVVFTPSPAKDDFAAAICDIDRIAYVTAGAKRWAIMDPVRLTSEVGDQLTDVVYTVKSPRTFTSAKNLVFYEGNLYQVWRNTSYAVTLQLPAGGQRRVAENEILALRYYPRRQRRPCWDAVKDVGGYSLFVGRNNAVSMYAEGVPGLRGNCVYWIDRRGRDQGMAFDMESGRFVQPLGYSYKDDYINIMVIVSTAQFYCYKQPRKLVP
ncbi:unnamed protein product [Miscanthus lutarioriparius]|uniref:KIB1-4 beta-propeller domain-containing protein n=1 Tax=Miscanthus lutarioriparius TaxID=422564 RepID=A0A811N550_9POAL|nr:unnamed protein product [Miscanthus lutarioriparius]